MSNLMPGQPAPDGKNRPYSQPIQWIDWERRFGVPPPYASPTQEFRENQFMPTMDDLLFRWQGLEKFIPEIHRLYSDPLEILERDRFQMIRRRQMGVPDFNDPEDVRIDTYFDLRMVQARIDSLNEELTGGFEKVIESKGNLTEGWERIEVRRPLSAKSKAMKEDSLRRFMELKRLLREQPTSIGEVRQKGTTVRDEIREAFAERGHVNPSGYTWEEIQAAKETPQLPEESTVVYDERNSGTIVAGSLSGEREDKRDGAGGFTPGPGQAAADT